MDAQRRKPGRRHGRSDVDRVIAALARSQGGVVGREQLLRLRVSHGAIDHRVRAGRLIAVFRAVYAVGHEAIGDRGRAYAGLIAAGPHAVLSHWTAAALWKLISSMPPFIEVTVTGSARRSRPGLRIHETRRPPDVRTIHSLPVTAPLRTLADLAATQSHHQLERLCAEALVLRLVTHEQLEAARILPPATAAPTRSRFEREFFAALRNAGLPQPLVNHSVPPYIADFAWPEQRVVVETDGWRFHGHRLAFEDDRARDADLAASGWIVVRITWRQLQGSPTLVLVQLAQTLARRS
jgi:very-short-patch-repair endonuclease